MLSQTLLRTDFMDYKINWENENGKQCCLVRQTRVQANKIFEQLCQAYGTLSATLLERDDNNECIIDFYEKGF